MDDAATQTILEKFIDLQPLLDERARTVWAATEARALGWGGISRVTEATGMSRVTIANGLKELAAGVDASDRQRALGRRQEAGGGAGSGSGEGAGTAGGSGDAGRAGPLLWTSLSASRLAAALWTEVSERTVTRLLRAGYSLRRTARKGGTRIATRSSTMQPPVGDRAAAMVVSVDTKKKELDGGRGVGGAGKGEACTTSRTRSSARPSPTGCTTWRPTRSWVTRRHGPRHGVVRGGDAAALVGADGTRRVPGGAAAAGDGATPAARTAAATGCGSWSSSASLTRPG